MTDREEFIRVIKAHGVKLYEIASVMGMSPQSLYNKLGNTTQFTQAELLAFKDKFPDVDHKTFEKIFFAEKLTCEANE